MGCWRIGPLKALTIVCVLFLGAFGAEAQSPVLLGTSGDGASGQSEAAPPTDAEIKSLIAALEDESARQALIRQLELLVAADRKADEEAPGKGSLRDLGDLDAVSLFGGAWAWAKGRADAVLNADPEAVVINLALSGMVVLAVIVLRFLFGYVLSKMISSAPQDREERRFLRLVQKTLRWVKRLISLGLLFVGAVVILQIWGIDVLVWMANPAARDLIETLFSLGLTIAVAVFAFEISSHLVTRFVEQGAEGFDQRRQAARLRAIVPLLNGVIRVTIGIFATLMILSELGVNIGPLLAGAGVIGLAVGFGAQSLVKNLITGITILIQDSATVGDVVEVDGHAGVVEQMNIGMMRLRDLAGVVHTVPYGEIGAIKNYTKDFSYYVFDVGVAYRENTDEVVDVLRQLDEEMRADGKYGDMILDSLEILGVDALADSAVVIKARYKTKPANRWQVGREFNRRIKLRFDELGIEIPFPHQTIYFGEQKDGTAPPAPVKLLNAG